MADEIKQETVAEATPEVKKEETPVEVKEQPATPVETKKEDTAKAEVKKPANKQFNQKRDMKKPRRSSLGDNFEERIRIKRISKTTKGGRHMRFSALVIVGDRQGRVGFGIGKANETPNAIKKAIKNARKALVRVNITKDGSIYHEIVGRKGASRVLIKPAKKGTGIIAGSVIRDILELAGYKDIYTKNLGSNSPLNMVTAVVNGLKKQLLPNQVLKARDKFVDKKQQKPNPTHVENKKPEAKKEVK
ncbi:MAG: 30S ribosomal protein S5 [Malacoplasma sp.]|nr:30S ribosomal protein S5 [Malacoplasma sp.]